MSFRALHHSALVPARCLSNRVFEELCKSIEPFFFLFSALLPQVPARLLHDLIKHSRIANINAFPVIVEQKRFQVDLRKLSAARIIRDETHLEGMVRGIDIHHFDILMAQFPEQLTQFLLIALQEPLSVSSFSMSSAGN